MPYVNVPNDLSKIKTKIAFNLTKRQLVCFGIGAAIGVPTYLDGSHRQHRGAVRYADDHAPGVSAGDVRKGRLTFEKVIRNIVRVKFTRPGIRPYRTENIYAPFVRKEEPIEQSKEAEKSK